MEIGKKVKIFGPVEGESRTGRNVAKVEPFYREALDG